MLRKALRQFLTDKHSLPLRGKYLVILLGTIIWSLTMIRSGIKYPFGYGFWGANGHDGIWHLALAKSLSEGSFNNPVFAGEFLKNYHLGFDLLLSTLHRLTGIQISLLYFQILPIIFAFLIGFLVYRFVYLWRGLKNEALWATAFVYFGSSFGFIITYLRDGVFSGESMFWSQQSVSTLVNPPFALSLIFILLGLIALQKKKLILSILFFGILIQIKAYSAILVLAALFAASLYSYYIQHTTYYIRVFLGSLLLNLLLLILVKNDGLSTFVWQPFWFLETMMSYSDRLGWERFYSAMTTYKMGNIWFKEILAYTVAFVIFILGNMGTRILGLYFVYKSKVDNIFVFVISVCVMAVAIPMFFVQSGTPWNTIQFFYYYLFFLSIFAGIVISSMKSWIKYLFVIFSIFGIWMTLQHYLPKMPQAIISSDESEALSFLSKQPNGIVFTYPFDSDKAKEATKNPPRSLYLYDSTAYVAAYSGKQVFLEDEVNLNIMGYSWQTRREEVLWFISNLDIEKGQIFLKMNNIRYLYLVKVISPLHGELLKLGSTELELLKIFENKGYIIYQYGENIGSN